MAVFAYLDASAAIVQAVPNFAVSLQSFFMCSNSEQQLKQDAELDQEAQASTQATRRLDPTKSLPSALEIDEDEEERTDFHRWLAITCLVRPPLPGCRIAWKQRLKQGSPLLVAME